MYILLETHKVGQMASLDNTKGATGQLAEDPATGNLYLKYNGVWTQMTSNGSAGGNSATHANSAVITNGQSVVLKNHAGTVSSGNAGLNSAGTVANVATGVLSAVQAGA